MINLDKPRHGQPCNGCGHCCMAEDCALAYGLFQQDQGRCPALEEAGDKYQCGLVANPAKYAPIQALCLGEPALSKAALLLIGSGIGCDAQEVGEPRDEGMTQRIIEYRAVHGESVEDALAMWGLVPV